MAWVCKDCGFATDEDKTGDNRCPQCGETMDKKPKIKASDPDFFGDKEGTESPDDLDRPRDILEK